MAPRCRPDQVLDATLACVARVGVAKTTLEDVAREAGCARASVYRYFPGKQQLLAALVAREAAALGVACVARGRAASTLDDAVAGVVTHAVRALEDHAALAFVVAHEPECLLPYLAFKRESAVLAAAADLVAPAFEPFLPRAAALRLAEWVARLTLSFLCCPSEHVDLHDSSQVRSLVADFVLPGFARFADTFQGVSQ
jgi:AcrR family transcriptional regulator